MSELNTQIPRIDPDNKLGADFHAARATERFRTDRMAIDGKEPEDLATAKFRDGDNAQDMRARISDYLNVINNVHSPKEVKLLNVLKDQHGDAALVWTHLIPIDTTDMPDQEALAAWLLSLSHEQLAEIATYKYPQVQIIPKGKMVDYLDKIEVSEFCADFPALTDYQEALTEWKEFGFMHWAEAWKDVGSDSWKFSITNGVDEMPMIPELHYEDPDHTDYSDPEQQSKDLRAILNGYIELYESNGGSMMPQYAYIPALLTAFLDGRTFDTQKHTIFKPNSALGDTIPCAHLDGSTQLYLDQAVEDDDLGRYITARPYFESK